LSKLIFTVLKIALIPLMVLMLITVGQTFFAGNIHFNSHTRLWFWGIFGGAILVRSLFSFFCLRIKKTNPFHFIDTLEHELTHALFGYLTLTPPKSLWASQENEGEVTLARHNVFIVLAPYFFPLWTFITLALGLLIQKNMQFAWNSLTLFLLSFYVYRLFFELRWYQTDLAIYGRVFSLLFVCIAFILSLATILHYTGVADGNWLAGIPLDVYHRLEELQAVTSK